MKHFLFLVFAALVGCKTLVIGKEYNLPNGAKIVESTHRHVYIKSGGYLIKVGQNGSVTKTDSLGNVYLMQKDGN
jgi:hypothetical protein